MKKLYIQMFSIHGLLRSRNMELGRDADTGGQIKYVVELAEALSRDERVEQVDLFTRLIVDKRVSADYGEAVETVSDRFRIIRIQCGGKRYVRKELLWPYLDEYVDKTVHFIKREGRNPDIVHGHYPDAGYVALLLSEYFGTPFVYTGHSMGHAKLSRLLAEGMREEEIVRKYHIDHRIEVEEEVIKNADLIVASTSQEVETQYGMYRHHALARYRVMPPGINLEVFYPYQRDLMPASPKTEEAVVAYGSVTEELNRFFTYPDRPLILALCRADKRKNIAGLIHAYGTDKELRAIANLAIFAGIRKNIGDMEDNEKDVLTEMLLLMDRYDLYGRMAIPKKHDFTYEVPELYRITAERKGVFVNVALTEPFGLTLIEAAACGLPIVATRDGGPQDIIRNCENGVLVDPLNPKAIAKAIKGLLVDREKWRQCSGNGIRGVTAKYNWDAHVQHYLDELRELEDGGGRDIYKRSAANPVGERLTRLQAFIVTDIDDTLLGDDEALERLKEILARHRDTLGFGVATGRVATSALKVLAEHGLPSPDVLITSVGAEMYYRADSFQDKGWRTHISKRWNREKIQGLLESFDFLEYQEEETQRPFKISYYMSPDPERLPRMYEVLARNHCPCNIIYSHDQFLDILPYRASKGKAVRYLSYKWDIPLHGILVCGDSGNDTEMLTGGTLGVVVGNYKPELESIRGRRNVFFAESGSAAGIIEGLHHYRLLDRLVPGQGPA